MDRGRIIFPMDAEVSSWIRIEMRDGDEMRPEFPSMALWEDGKPKGNDDPVLRRPDIICSCPLMNTSTRECYSDVVYSVVSIFKRPSGKGGQ